MADGTHIEWTSATWNPITGCAVISPGCTNCYAMRLAGTRLRNHPSRQGLTSLSKAGPVWTGEIRFNEQWLEQPVHWTRPRDIFVCAHSDLFHRHISVDHQDRIFEVIREASRHRYQILTKRPYYMLDYLRNVTPMPHVWLGVSIEDELRAKERREPLAALAAAGWNTWVSYEPALGPVDWTDWEFIRWFVGGGESGRDARPSHPTWHRIARDFCVPRGIPYFHKQNGGWLHQPERAHFKELAKEPWQRVESRLDGIRPALMFNIGKKAAGALLDGREWKQMPGAAL